MAVAEENARPLSETGAGLGPAERRLLAGMPLHAITSVHGEAGLRERLLMSSPGSPLPTAAGPPMRWHWHPGCTPETGGSASPTSATCSG